ncbi:MAG: nucleotidyltransferase domain-containing protein [Patescibacteria group bacterium]
MGQVFTWKEIVRKRVPQLGDFAIAIGEARSLFERKDVIVGAIVCGSVTRGDHNVRSDVDCFVLYDHEREHEAFTVIQTATSASAHRRVPLVCIPCDTLLSGTYMHHIGGSFLWHLQKAVEMGGLLKGDPLQLVTDLRSRQEEAESYLRVKMYNLQESWGMIRTFSEERIASYLKKLLEAPVHIARKMLAHQGLLSGDSKQQVCARYEEHMDTALSEKLEKLVGLDTRYSEELRAQLERPDEKKYRRTCDAILTKSEDVLSFVRANAMYLDAMRLVATTR